MPRAVPLPQAKPAAPARNRAAKALRATVCETCDPSLGAAERASARRPIRMWFHARAGGESESRRRRGDQPLRVVAVAIQDGSALFNAFVAPSLDQLIGFSVKVGLKPLRYLGSTRLLERGKSIGGGIGKGNDVGVDLFHGVVSFGC